MASFRRGHGRWRLEVRVDAAEAEQAILLGHGDEMAQAFLKFRRAGAGTLDERDPDPPTGRREALVMHPRALVRLNRGDDVVWEDKPPRQDRLELRAYLRQQLVLVTESAVAFAIRPRGERRCIDDAAS